MSFNTSDADGFAVALFKLLFFPVNNWVADEGQIKTYQ